MELLLKPNNIRSKSRDPIYTRIASFMVLYFLLHNMLNAVPSDGEKLYEAGKYAEAAEYYANMIKNHKAKDGKKQVDQKLQFNYGTALLANKQYKEAHKVFTEALSAGTKSKLNKEIFYNSGNALGEEAQVASGTNLEEAIKLCEDSIGCFGNALELDKEFTDAKHNLEAVKKYQEELMKRKEEQEKNKQNDQNQKQDNKDKDKNQDDKRDNNSEDKNKEEEKKEENQDKKEEEKKQEQEKKEEPGKDQKEEEKKEDPPKEEKKEEEKKEENEQKEDEQPSEPEKKPEEKPEEKQDAGQPDRPDGKMTMKEASELLDSVGQDERAIPVNLMDSKVKNTEKIDKFW
jgi:hypothetical protein